MEEEEEEEKGEEEEDEEEGSTLRRNGSEGKRERELFISSLSLSESCPWRLGEKKNFGSGGLGQPKEEFQEREREKKKA